jgi:hypothetical protein
MRSTTKFLHPMHLHGHRFEVLEVFAPPVSDCTLNRCPLTTYFDSPAKRAELAAIPMGTHVYKDSVTMPGGGAVAIRFGSDNPGVWLAHCHINLHMDDGMMWLNIEGDLDAAKTPRDRLPADFPQCDDANRVDHHPEHPHCDCYENEDNILNNYLPSNYKCSREALCFQVCSVTSSVLSIFHCIHFSITSLVLSIITCLLAFATKHLLMHFIASFLTYKEKAVTHCQTTDHHFRYTLFLF